MSDSPAAVIVDSSSNEVSVTSNRLDTNATIDAALPAGTNNIGDVDVVSSALPTGAATETTLATLATEAKLEAVRVLLASLDAKDYATETKLEAVRALLAAEDFASETTLAALNVNAGDIETILTAIRDTAGIKKITDSLPAGSAELGAIAQGTKGALVDAWPTVPTDAAGNAYTSQLDAGVRRLEIAGKVAVVGALPPPSTNALAIFGDTPLVVGTNDTTLVIPTGETAHLQQLSAGNEDPTKGAVVEVLYDDGSEHLIARIYTSGQSELFGFADVTQARDGTPLVGTGTETLILRRSKYSGSDIAIDAVVRGYTV